MANDTATSAATSEKPATDAAATKRTADNVEGGSSAEPAPTASVDADPNDTEIAASDLKQDTSSPPDDAKSEKAT